MNGMSFQGFAKQRLRMCYQATTFKECPLSEIVPGCMACESAIIGRPERAESIVAKWAAENPEQYTMSDFKAGKIAVIPGTTENARRFLDECAKAGLRWCGGDASNSAAAVAYLSNIPAWPIACEHGSVTFATDAIIRSCNDYTYIPFSALTLPELVYPTWAEWQKEKFPDADRGICLEAFMGGDLAMCNKYKKCDDCRHRPIPADIAAKLGVKPKGESHQ